MHWMSACYIALKRRPKLTDQDTNDTLAIIADMPQLIMPVVYAKNSQIHQSVRVQKEEEENTESDDRQAKTVTPESQNLRRGIDEDLSEI